MELNRELLPRHVAIIMDGNRRWARERGLSAIEGHQYVTDTILEALTDRCIELGISHLTLWAFSTENWERDQEELTGMMKLFRYGLSKKADFLFKKGVRIRVLGELSRFPTDIAQACKLWMQRSEKNTTITVTFALNYGGRDEIVRAVNRFLQSAEPGQEFTAQDMTENLDSLGLPDPDLIIRPGGQFRLSGFMPWQSVYSELYFSPVLMPDFTVAELDKALLDFTQRQRRYGK